MKKQYLAQVKFKNSWDGKWMNATIFLEQSYPRYLETKEQAEEVIRKTLAKHNGRKPGYETSYVGTIGILMPVDEKMIDDNTIIETRIRCREVSEWEDC